MRAVRPFWELHKKCFLFHFPKLIKQFSTGKKSNDSTYAGLQPATNMWHPHTLQADQGFVFLIGMNCY